MVVDQDSRRRRLVSDYPARRGLRTGRRRGRRAGAGSARRRSAARALICDASALRDRFAAEMRSRAAKVLVMTDAGDRTAPADSLRRPFQLIDLGAKLLFLLRRPALSSPER